MGWSLSKQILVNDPQRWVTLKEKLDSSIFGQHIAIGEVFFKLKAHFKNPSPQKALVIICNGAVGTGKTYFCRIVVNEIYDSGFSNPACKLFICTKEFTDSRKIIEYQNAIRKKIEEAVKKDKWAAFIFDEVDLAPNGLLDVLTPYVTQNAVINEIDYTCTTFIFISNSGGTIIRDVLLSHSQSESNVRRSREELTLFHFQEVLKDTALNEKGGLKNSNIIRNKLIDHHVPFMPLERKHIVECINNEHQIRNYILINYVLDALDYEPKHKPIFVIEGAKNIQIQLGYAMAQGR